MSDSTDTDNGMAFITLSEAAKRFPTINGRHFHAMTVTRWVRDGVKVHGETVRLRATRVSRTQVTTMDWMAEFLEAAGR